jgi:thiamine kinase-like enzyme
MTNKEKVIEVCLNVFNCHKTDIHIESIEFTGRSNRLFLVEIDDKKYTVRLPGKKSDLFIDRETEVEALKIAYAKDLTSKTVYFDVKSGVKVSRYIDGTVLSQTNAMDHVDGLVNTLKALHQDHGTIAPYQPFSVITQLESTITLYKEPDPLYKQLKSELLKDYQSFEHEKVLIHGDFNVDNIVVSDRLEMYLLDFEYSTVYDPIYDIACLMSHSETLAVHVLEAYYQSSAKALRQKLYYYRVIQCLKWYNIATIKHVFNLGLDRTIDFNGIAQQMLQEAQSLYKTYKELSNK